MPLKSRMSSYLAGITGTLMLILSFFHDVRWTTLLYRTFLTMLIFGIVGFLAGIFLETYLKQPAPNEDAHKGQNIDIAAAPDEHPLGAAPQNQGADAEFKPLNSDSLMSYSTRE